MPLRLQTFAAYGFRCFNPEGIVIEVDDLSCFIGPNGAGKTAALTALRRLFGVDASERRIRPDDFFLKNGELLSETSERSLRPEATFVIVSKGDEGEDDLAEAATFEHMVVGEPGRLHSKSARPGTAAPRRGDRAFVNVDAWTCVARSPAVASKQDSQLQVRLGSEPAIGINVIDGEMISRLQETLDQIDKDKNVRVLILTSAQPGIFCAGGDLKYFAELKTPDEALAMCRRMKTVLNRFENGPQVVIAAIDGAVHGGACEMILSCHFRIATPDSTFSFRHAARGLPTAWGGAARLFRLPECS